MASSFQLSGPPELKPQPLPFSPPSPALFTGEPFIDLMVSNFNKTKIKDKVNPPRGYTENHSPTFKCTGNPCLDFFFHAVPSTPSHRQANLLDAAWKHNGLTTLKLICQLRGVRGVAKSDKEGFYNAALWLHKHHPKTLACNLKVLAGFGCLKDLLEILQRILEGKDERSAEPPQHPTPSNGKGSNRGKKSKKRLEVEAKKAEIEKEKARELKKEEERAKARKAVGRYLRDPDYRFLHDQTAQAFADYLVSDMKSLKAGETCKISFASKFCPSLDSSYDKATLLCESIAKRVFPRESCPEYEGFEDAHYAYRVRDRLRKEVLVPLREALELPEVYMTANKWDTLPYSRVDAEAMTNYKKNFFKHDEIRFSDFLDKAERGEAKLSAEGLLPHEIVNLLEDVEDGGQIAELQWNSMVEDMATKGKLKNCIAVLDVSKSMKGTPMEAGMALSVLLSELSERPWKGKIIVFDRTARMGVTEGDDLRSKTDSIKNIHRDLLNNVPPSTDYITHMNRDQSKKIFQKVFDQILEVATAVSLNKEHMIKTVFVFSDMEFGSASGRRHSSLYDCSDNWDTDYEVIKKKFENQGYTIPEIVFWNLKDSEATPVACDQERVALVAGFSINLMKLFIGEQEIGVKDPQAVMEASLLGSEYEELIVLD